MKPLVYTFRTCPFLQELIDGFGDVFVFGKLKADLVTFQEILESAKPEFIIGFAGASKRSTIEQRVQNRFNRTKVVRHDGPAEYWLSVPRLTLPNMIVSALGTDSFCNWVGYQVSHRLAQSGHPAQHAFIHAFPPDVPQIVEELNGALVIGNASMSTPPMETRYTSPVG